jgi:hypothetical protein
MIFKAYGFEYFEVVKMKCKSCKRNDEEFFLAFMPRGLCGDCFLKNLHKRIRKNIRLNRIIKPKEKVEIINDDTLNSKVLLHFLTEFEKDMPFTIVKKSKVKIYPDDLLDADLAFLKKVMLKDKLKIKRAPLNVIHPEEIKIYAKIHKLKAKKKVYSDDEKFIIKQLNILEKKYPSILFSIKKSYEKLK